MTTRNSPSQPPFEAVGVDDSTRDALDALERETNEGDGFEFDADQELGEEPLDEIDLTIQEYLDGELSDEARAAFEERIAKEPWLAERVEAGRNAFDFLDALGEEAEPNSEETDLTERTVDRLNKEAKEELDAIKARRDALRRRGKAVAVAVPILFLLVGYGVFAALAPNPQRQRERDAVVVERLIQLEAVGDFEYLQALADADLFEKWRQSLLPEMESRGWRRENVVSADVRDRPYDELVKDTTFYRLQRRFEALDRETQNKYRKMRRQIDASPEKEKLLQTLDDYAGWIVFSTSDSDRARLASIPIPARIQEIRRRLDAALRFTDAVRRQQGSRRPNGQPENRENTARNAGPGSSLRAALPPSLQRENFQSIYDKYVKFRSNVEKVDDGSSRHDDVLDFLAATDQNELIADFSKESKDELDSLDSEQRSSVMGLIVSLSFIENTGRFVQTRPFQNNEWRNRRRAGSVQELGETLSKANPRARDYVTSLPPLEARGALMSLNWGVANGNFFNANSQNSPNDRNGWNFSPSNTPPGGSGNVGPRFGGGPPPLGAGPGFAPPTPPNAPRRGGGSPDKTGELR